MKGVGPGKDGHPSAWHGLSRGRLCAGLGGTSGHKEQKEKRSEEDTSSKYKGWWEGQRGQLKREEPAEEGSEQPGHTGQRQHSRALGFVLGRREAPGGTWVGRGFPNCHWKAGCARGTGEAQGPSGAAQRSWQKCRRRWGTWREEKPSDQE